MPPPKKPVNVVPKQPNPSLSYQVLVYLNSFYFGMFAACELSMGLLKAINLSYEGNTLTYDSTVIIGLCILETIRIIFGRKGALADKDWKAVASVVLIVPCFFGVCYILLLQTYKLRLEYLLGTLQLGLYISQIWYAIKFVISLCRPVTYD